jgi:hypothetical protein
LILFGILVIFVMYVLMLSILSMDRPKIQPNQKHVVCDGMTSTGAPYDCHEVDGTGGAK